MIAQNDITRIYGVLSRVFQDYLSDLLIKLIS
ncbi:hypothetical protein HCH_04605 [Hahella chejuensis KCTC 2396]|uniref:Uncharacterized protein n=1 Tax=Hahella chejuensis (strain KCTC 2396) TaxID=349521 RepID=Q2SDG8_HAHCH|nr:hypothetical protein HCH_04605 [Hahella chejuensis KCTC 2396]